MSRRSSPIGLRRLRSTSADSSLDVRIADRLSRLDGKASREHREPREQTPALRRRAGRNSIRSSRGACAGARERRGRRRSGAATPARAARAAPRGRGAACEQPQARSPAAGCRVSCRSPRSSRPARMCSADCSGTLDEERDRVVGSSGSRGYSTSPEMRSGARLVASTRRPAAVARRSATVGAAPRRCSKLSRSSTSSRSRRKPPRSSGAPIACAISLATRLGSVERAEGTQKTPSETVPTSSAAT